MALIEYTCPICQKSFEEIKSWPFAKTETCKTPGCDGTAILGMGIIKSYKINGNNSASVTPKKFRGER